MRQFLRATTAHITEDEHVLVAGTLSPAQAELFYRQDRSDQRHALDVYQTLRAGGHDAPALLQAALLHDVGKSAGPARIPLPYRVAIVLVRAVRPAWLERLARPHSASWRYPFHIHNQHPARGAELAGAARSSASVVRLIAIHHAPGDDPLAQALCQADGVN